MSTIPVTVIIPEQCIPNMAGWGVMTIGPTNDLEFADEAEDDPEWDDDDDAYTDAGDYEDPDEEWCSAPGRGGGGLCSDDLCRGAGVCMYEGAER
jgi:hypothetical protein